MNEIKRPGSSLARRLSPFDDSSFPEWLTISDDR